MYTTRLIDHSMLYFISQVPAIESIDETVVQNDFLRVLSSLKSNFADDEQGEGTTMDGETE